MEWIKTENQKPKNNEEVLVYFDDHEDVAIMIYESSPCGEYYSFVEDDEIYYPELWARIYKPKAI